MNPHANETVGMPKTNPTLKNRWTAEPYRLEDLPALGSFFKRVYTGRGVYGTMGMFQWKIRDNSTREGFINLVRTPTGIGATASLAPKTLLLHGQPLAVAEVCDGYTDERYQRQGLFSLLINRTREDGNKAGIDFIYGTPNHQALPGHEKYANLKRIPQMQVRALRFITHPGALLKEKMPWLLANFIDFCFSSIVAIYLAIRVHSGSSRKIKIEEIGELPEDWNQFVAASSAPYDFIISRESKHFTWRYFANPNHYHILTARSGGRLTAMLVYRVVLDEKVSDLIIADYLALPDKPDALKPLIWRALSSSIRAGCLKATVWAPRQNRFYDVFRSCNFGGESEVPVICHQSPVALELIEDCKQWFFTVGDSDNA